MTEQPTMIGEEAMVLLLCAACLGLVRRMLQGQVDRRGSSGDFGPSEDDRFTGPGGATGATEELGLRLAGIVHSTDALSQLLDNQRGAEAAQARQLAEVVQTETAAALEEIRRQSPADPT